MENDIELLLTLMEVDCLMIGKGKPTRPLYEVIEPYLKAQLAKAKQHYELTACDKCDIRAVKSCPVINKLIELYPEIKLDLYLKTITGGK